VTGTTVQDQANDRQRGDIRLLIPVFLLKKLEVHPLTQGLYPISLGRSGRGSPLDIRQTTAEHYSLLYCHCGQSDLQYKNRNRRVNPGDIVIIEPHSSFHYSTQACQNSSSGTKKSHAHYWINFTGDLADDFAERLLMKMDDGLAQVGLLPNIMLDFDMLLELGARGYTATNVIHAVQVLQQALSFMALQLRLNAVSDSSTFDLPAIEELMRANLHQNLNLDTLAQHCKLSKFHFCKKFRELTDSSPIQHFINMKIQQACFQLDNSDIAIKDLAVNLGYSDPYYFSRLFKKIVGMSPRQYRESG
jgi:AraC family transcriptional regulator, arabinose operon regulatory protein